MSFCGNHEPVITFGGNFNPPSGTHLSITFCFNLPMTFKNIFNFSSGRCDKLTNDPKLKNMTPSAAELI